MEAAYHADGEAPSAIQDLRDARTRTDEGFEILSRESLLLHAKFDRLDRIRWIHGEVLGLIGLDEGCKHIEPIARWRPALRAP